jgi:GTP-binding protein
MNCLTGQNRSIVSPVAGTTRDAVDTVIEHEGRTYRIVDTAGIRRKSKIDESVEYFSFVRAMRAIDRADVALLVVDGTLGITNEDQRVANYAAERGCALAILLNKWDIVEGPEAKQDIRDGVEENMQFVKYAPVLAICALSGKNVHRVWDTIDTCFAHYTQKLPTSRLNAWMSQIHETGHTVTQGKTVLRIKYVTQTGVRPPAFTFFCNRPDVVTDNYERFLENRLRTGFDLTGTPVHFRFKKKD